VRHRARWRRQRLVPLSKAIFELRQLVERYGPAAESPASRLPMATYLR
jgi:hypothetical protein